MSILTTQPPEPKQLGHAGDGIALRLWILCAVPLASLLLLDLLRALFRW